MKKLAFLLISCVCVLNVHAQMTVTSRLGIASPYYIAPSIPQEFSYDNFPKLTICDESSNQKNLLVYDENLNLVKTVDLSQEMIFDYHLTYQDEQREVKEVTKVGNKQTGTYQSFQKFVEQNAALDPSFTTSLNIAIQENGDSLVTYDYSNSSYGMSNEHMYFAYNYFGRKYPKLYWICNKGTVYQYQTEYAISYTDWHTTGTHTSNESKNLGIIKLCNINLNQGDGKANYYFVVSQTLFNDDAEYEYIVPKYKLSSKGNVSSNNLTDIVSADGDETVTTTRSTILTDASKLALAGFTVVSADGVVVKEVLFDDNFEGNLDIDYAYVISIGNNTYLAFDGNMNDERATKSTIFYKIDRTTSGIQQVKIATASMQLSPTITERNSTIEIQLEDENKGGSVISVVSANGAQIKHVSMPVGERSTQLRIDAPAGVYCVSRVQKGKAIEMKKIIIR